MKVKVRSLDGNTDFFNIVAGVLQGDTLAPYLFIINLDHIIWISVYLMKENGFTLKMANNWWYPAETIMEKDYVDDIANLGNTQTKTKFLLHSLKLAARGIGLHMNADKMKF